MPGDWNTLTRGESICWIRKAHDWKMADEYTFQCKDCPEKLPREEYIKKKQEEKKKGFFR